MLSKKYFLALILSCIPMTMQSSDKKIAFDSLKATLDYLNKITPPSTTTVAICGAGATIATLVAQQARGPLRRITPRRFGRAIDITAFITGGTFAWLVQNYGWDYAIKCMAFLYSMLPAQKRDVQYVQNQLVDVLTGVNTLQNDMQSVQSNLSTANTTLTTVQTDLNAFSQTTTTTLTTIQQEQTAAKNLQNTIHEQIVQAVAAATNFYKQSTQEQTEIKKNLAILLLQVQTFMEQHKTTHEEFKKFIVEQITNIIVENHNKRVKSLIDDQTAVFNKRFDAQDEQIKGLRDQVNNLNLVQLEMNEKLRLLLEFLLPQSKNYGTTIKTGRQKKE